MADNRGSTGVRACRVVAILLLGGAVGCGPARQPATARPPAPRHVVFITIDTLRADRVGSYGRRDAATPNLDRLAREGALAPEATSPAPLTRPSHTTIFTGRYPAEHGIRDNVSAALSADVPTLAEQFERHGFQTAAFISSIVLSSQSGLSRGFQTYSEKFGDDNSDDARFLNTIQRRGCGRTRARRHSSGCTSTIRTIRTNHRSRSPAGSPSVPTTERSPGPTSSWAASTVRSKRRAFVTRR
jgi:hypothetical protein